MEKLSEKELELLAAERLTESEGIKVRPKKRKLYDER